LGLPDGLLDRLIEIKEKEKAIDWYESEYQQIMDYAVFPDLLQILEHSADGFPQIMRLAPTSALLHARFLELEVMRAKLGRARPISETELAFLGTFHLRFRKAIEEFQLQPLARPSTADTSQAPTTETAGATVANAEPDVEILDETSAAPEAEAFEDEDTGPPRRRATTPTGKPDPDGDESPEEPPDSDDEDHEVEDGDDGDHDEKDREPDVNAIDAALEKGDDVAVLREIYREVTSTAEGIWTRDVLPNHRIWNKVSTSTWYEENFSRLGLKPVSDYYEIISKVDRQMREGTPKEEIQEYLKGSNFAQILLALRDMFQRNII